MLNQHHSIQTFVLGYGDSHGHGVKFKHQPYHAFGWGRGVPCGQLLSTLDASQSGTLRAAWMGPPSKGIYVFKHTQTLPDQAIGDEGRDILARSICPPEAERQVDVSEELVPYFHAD